MNTGMVCTGGQREQRNARFDVTAAAICLTRKNERKLFEFLTCL